MTCLTSWVDGRLFKVPFPRQTCSTCVATRQGCCACYKGGPSNATEPCETGLTAARLATSSGVWCTYLMSPAPGKLNHMRLACTHMVELMHLFLFSPPGYATASRPFENVPSMSMALFSEHWPFGKILSYALSYLQGLSVCASSCTMVAISFERSVVSIYVLSKADPRCGILDRA